MNKSNETLMILMFHNLWICKLKRCSFPPTGDFTCYFTIPVDLVECLSAWEMNKKTWFCVWVLVIKACTVPVYFTLSWKEVASASQVAE